MRLFLLFLGILCAAPSGGDFQPLRPPILGFVVEKNTQGDVYRLVTVEDPHGDAPRKVVVTGTADTCEERLLEILKKKYGTGNINIPFATMGGKQFWADLVVYCGWRIQKNEFTGHCRLLDTKDRRQAWGTYEACRVALEEQKVRRKLKPRSTHVVVLVHGLFRSKDSFAAMAKALEKAGYEVASVNYPSTRASIHAHARQLKKVLDAMEGARKVSFVTHSLGGIIVRDLLARDGAWKSRLEVGRLVMLGPPNRGSLVASVLKNWFPYKVVAGKSGQELTPREVGKIPPPDCSFGIIAGGTGKARGISPLLPGDNDGTVLVEHTRLDGADDFLLVNCRHSSLMRDKTAIEATVRFLKKGRFRPARPARRLPWPEPRPVTRT